MSGTIQRMVIFEPTDLEIVQQVARENGFGSRGFSTSIRFILRSWWRDKMARGEEQTGSKDDSDQMEEMEKK